MATAHELERAAQPVEQFMRSSQGRAAFAADLEARVIESHLQRIAETDEGVAPETLAALHAFEQKARLERHELGRTPTPVCPDRPQCRMSAS